MFTLLKFRLFSQLYRITRRAVILIVHAWQRLTGQAKDLETSVLLGDKAMGWLYRSFAGRWLFDAHYGGADNTTYLYDLAFTSPLTFSSFKYHLDTLAIWLSLGIGGGCCKTVVEQARPGNPRPRLQTLHRGGHEGIINCMGLPSEGVDRFIDSIKQCQLLNVKQPVGFSIGGDDADEMYRVFKKINQFLQASATKNTYFELNISCPNVDKGKNIADNPQLLGDLLQRMRAETQYVIGVKLSRDTDDAGLLTLATITAATERTYLNLGNTEFLTEAEAGLDAGSLSYGGGGACGPSLFNGTLHMVRLLKPINIPIIATGGVSTVDQVIRLQTQGATLVGMATAIVSDPFSIVAMTVALNKRQ